MALPASKDMLLDSRCSSRGGEVWRPAGGGGDELIVSEPKTHWNLTHLLGQMSECQPSTCFCDGAFWQSPPGAQSQTPDFWGQIILGCGAAFYKRLSSISGLYPPGASSHFWLRHSPPLPPTLPTCPESLSSIGLREERSSN